MGTTLRSASALLCCLSLLILTSTASEDLLTRMQKSRIQESEGERDASSTSDGSLEEALGFSRPKEYVSDVSSSTQAHSHLEDSSNAVETSQCELSEDTVKQLKSVGESEWLIDDAALETLNNDPQDLIRCTRPGDRVTFKLTGVHKFNRTLTVAHDLELINESPATDNIYNGTRREATFTCPRNGAFLIVKSVGFNASGFVVQNCAYSAIGIQSMAKVVLESVIFRSNSATAIFVSSNVNLALQRCYFENFGDQHSNGRAISVESNVFLLIQDSFFYGNQGYNAGAISSNGHNVLTILSSNFSSNVAGYRGGAINIGYRDDLTIIGSTLSDNQAGSDGGAIYVPYDCNLTIIDSTLSRNQANRGGGVMSLAARTNVTIVNSVLSDNTAGADGGAIAAYLRHVFNMTNSSFIGNEAGGAGGLMYMGEANRLNLARSFISYNHAAHEGGAVYLFSDNNCTISDSTFLSNEARTGASLFLGKKTTLNIISSTFSNNFASQFGTIYASVDCVISIQRSNIIGNKGEYGGFLYGNQLSLSVSNSNCNENVANKSGGCFHLKSTKATFTKTKMSMNLAEEDGAGVYATAFSDVLFDKCTMKSNQANKDGGGVYSTMFAMVRFQRCDLKSNRAKRNGGAVAILPNSRLICGNSTIQSNVALHGGGVYIEPNVRQPEVSQIITSTIQSNIALKYGGGIVVKTFGVKDVNFSDIYLDCGRVLIIDVTLTNNIAKLTGAGIMATSLDGILISCQPLWPTAWPNIITVATMRRLVQYGWLTSIDLTQECRYWRRNRLSGTRTWNAVGMFGQKLHIKIGTEDEAYTTNDGESDLVLRNVTSGKPLPRIEVSAFDVVGHVSVPLHEEDAIVWSSPNGFLARPITFSFENSTCLIEGIVRFVLPGNYTIKFDPKSDDVLEAKEMTFIVRECVNDEEPALDGKVCEPCGDLRYNFNSPKANGCSPCPKGGNCTNHYIFPTKGYWNKSPCHDQMKKCIIEKACDYANRTRMLTSLVQQISDCDMNETRLETYEKAQCYKGYKGPLCGSCKKSYSLSSNFECSKCGHAIIIVLRFIGAIVYLLAGTIITIKGVLPSNSGEQGHDDAETPLLEQDDTTSMDAANSSQVREDVENGNQDPSQPANEPALNYLNSDSQEMEDIEVTKLKLVSSLKISLNYFQVTSTAARMDVEWTKRIIDLLKGLNILGAATNDSMSYSFDCVFSSASNASKAVWRLLFSLFVPLIVISLLAFHWGYRTMSKRGGDRLYFLRRLTLTVITVTYATYFDLTQVAMRTFSCVVVHTNNDPFSNAITRYWIGDTSLECYQSTHIGLICISLAIVAMVTIGFPMFSSFTLSQHKSEARDTSSWTFETLGFLGGPFKERFIYWECVTMVKKAILSIIIVFSYSLEVQAQGLLILLVLVFFLYIHFLTYPYDEVYHSLNYYESGSLLVSCVTYTLVQFFNVEQVSKVARSLVSLSIIGINVGFVCLMAHKIAIDLAHLLRALLKSQYIHIPHNMNVFSLIRIYYNKRRSRQNAT